MEPLGKSDLVETDVSLEVGFEVSKIPSVLLFCLLLVNQDVSFICLGCHAFALP